MHQGWLTTDHKYFLLDDETDELDGFPYEMGYAPDKRLSVEIFDMTDLDAARQLGRSGGCGAFECRCRCGSGEGKPRRERR